MISWIVRGLLVVAGVVVSWFMSKDASQFGLMEMAVAMLLIVFIVGVLAFWPERWTHFINRVHRPH